MTEARPPALAGLMGALRRREAARFGGHRAIYGTRRRRGRKARRTRAAPVFEPVAQLPELRNRAPTFVAFHRACIEIVVQTSQARRTVQKAADAAVKVNEIEHPSLPGHR